MGLSMKMKRPLCLWPEKSSRRNMIVTLHRSKACHMFFTCLVFGMHDTYACGVSLTPKDTYGLEKLYHEEMCKAYAKDFPIETRMARYHNVYGPRGTWKVRACLPVRVFVCVPVCLPVCLFVCLFVCLSVSVSDCSSACLAVWVYSAR